MQPGSNPSLRLILAHLEHPTGRLDLSPDAPPGNKGSSERRISKVDREGVVQRPAGSRGRHSPTVRAAVLVEPIGHLRVPLPGTFWWYGDPDAYGEAAFRQGDHSAWVARHLCSRRQSDGILPQFRRIAGEDRKSRHIDFLADFPDHDAGRVLLIWHRQGAYPWKNAGVSTSVAIGHLVTQAATRGLIFGVIARTVYEIRLTTIPISISFNHWLSLIVLFLLADL